MSTLPEWLTNLPTAHRGLHSADQGIEENSPAAFDAAIKAGFAIELDVRLTNDADAVVFHDAKLSRLTDDNRNIMDLSSLSVKEIKLSRGGERIPDLAETLRQIDGRVPVYVEIKNPGHPVGPLEARVAELLRSYRGPACVMSFNPFTLKEISRLIPSLPTGQLSYAYTENTPDRPSLLRRFLLRHLMLLPVSKPDFIAYDIRDLPQMAVRLAKLIGYPILAWTVKTDEELKRAQKYADNIIFEKLPIPSPATRDPAP